MARQSRRASIFGISALQRELPTAPTVDLADLNARRDRLTAAAAPAVAACVGVVLILSSIFRLHPLDAERALVAAVGCVALGSVLLLAAVVMATRGVADSGHAATLLVLLVAAVALCGSMLAMRTLILTAYVQLLIVIAGPVLLRITPFVSALVGIWALWLGLTAALVPEVDAAGWLLAMLAATVISVVLHSMRTDALRALGSSLLTAASQTVHDPLTGLLNRRGMDLVGHEAVALATRAREPVTCTVIDIDGLSRVNDAAGRAAGDRVIVAVADALSDTFRAADVIARWGSDDFVVLAVGSGPELAEIGSRLTRRLASDPDLPSVSLGRAVHLPWQDETLEEVLQRADQERLRTKTLARAHSDKGRE